MDKPTDAAAIRFPSPVVFAIALGLGLAATYFVPTPFNFPGNKGLALALMVLGVGFALAAIRIMRRAGTHVIPGQPSTSLVTAGPFRISRNPIYVGLAFLYLGIAIVFHSLWAILLLPCVLYTLYRTSIRPEEAYLERLFGEEYARYRRSVRRWL